MKIHDDKFIILTGGAGFIGSAVLRCLNDQVMNNIVVVDDLNSSTKWRNLVGKSFYDIISKYKIFEWLKNHVNDVEAIIHLGACSNTLEPNASYLLENNFHYSVKLAEIALRNDYRFIYASSAATYGDGSNGFSDDHNLLETLKPLNMYGYSKHLFDLWAKQQDVLNQIVGLKYFNVFGPNEYHKGRMASAISHMVPSAINTGVIRLFKSTSKEYADGDQCRDFIYVKDVAKMTCSFLNNTLEGIYNIGRGIVVTWNEIANTIIQSIDTKAHIEYIDMPKDLVKQYQNYTCADMKKFLSTFKEHQININNLTTDIKKAIKEYVCEYLIPEKTW